MRYFSLGLLALALGVEVAAHPASADEEAANQAEEIAHYNANHVDDYQDDYAEEMRKDGIDPEQQVFPDQGLAKPADDDDWWSEYQALFAEYGQEFSLNTEIFRDLKEDPEFLADQHSVKFETKADFAL